MCGGRLSICRAVAIGEVTFGTLTEALTAGRPLTVVTSNDDACFGGRALTGAIIGASADGNRRPSLGCTGANPDAITVSGDAVVSGVAINGDSSGINVPAGARFVAADSAIFSIQPVLFAGEGAVEVLASDISIGEANDGEMRSGSGPTSLSSVVVNGFLGTCEQPGACSLERVTFRAGPSLDGLVALTGNTELEVLALSGSRGGLRLDDRFAVVDQGVSGDIIDVGAYDVDLRVRGVRGRMGVGAQVLPPVPLPPGAGLNNETNPHELRRPIDLPFLKNAETIHGARMEENITSPRAFLGYARYAGTFDGGGHSLQVTRDCAGACAGFADRLEGHLLNLHVSGTVVGTNSASGLVTTCAGGRIGSPTTTTGFSGTLEATDLLNAQASGLVRDVGATCVIERARVGGGTTMTTITASARVAGAFLQVAPAIVDGAVNINNIVIGDRIGSVTLSAASPSSYSLFHGGAASNIEVYGLPTTQLIGGGTDSERCFLSRVVRHGGNGPGPLPNCGSSIAQGHSPSATTMGGLPWIDDDGVATLLP